MKKFLFIILTVTISCMAMASSNFSSKGADNYLEISGYYGTSAYDGYYQLLTENGFPKQACVMEIHLNELPKGYHYNWKIIKGYGDELLQVQPETDFAYIGQNWNTDELEFSISIIDESTGWPVASRTISFVFIKGFTKPIVPPIG